MSPSEGSPESVAEGSPVGKPADNQAAEPAASPGDLTGRAAVEGTGPIAGGRGARSKLDPLELFVDIEGLDLPGDVAIDQDFEEGESVDAQVADQDVLQIEADEPQSRALVVEADDQLRTNIVRLLRGKGLAVDECRGGLAALRQVRCFAPDLVVLDASIPELHAFDVTRKLRNTPRYRGLPIVLLSSIHRGWRIRHDLQQHYGIGALVEKPLKLSVLWREVRAALEGPDRARAQLSAAAMRLCRDGGRCFSEGDIDASIDRYREALRIEPLSARIHYQLGRLYLRKKGSVFHAISELEQALALRPDWYAATRTLALIYERRRFASKAIDLWERALRQAPDPAARQEIGERLVTLIREAASQA